jgi:hypothetical protein
MTEPIFDRDRLDVYRLSIDYVASSFKIAGALNGLHRHARDQWLRAAQSIPLNIADPIKGVRTHYCHINENPIKRKRGQSGKGVRNQYCSARDLLDRIILKHDTFGTGFAPCI